MINNQDKEEKYRELGQKLEEQSKYSELLLETVPSAVFSVDNRKT